MYIAFKMEVTRSVNVSKMPADKTADKKPRSTTKKTETVAPVAAPAPVAPAPKKERKAAVAKAEVTVPVTADAAAPAAPAPGFTDVATRLREVQSRVSSELKELARQVAAAAKAATREIKDAKRRKRRKDVSEMTEEERKTYEARRANNAFLKPRAISAELAAFMGLPAGTQRSHVDVSKFISQYVKSHNCFDPANKRHIIPDGALAKLLKVTDKDQVTYLNLQRYLKVHYPKSS
jgi:hypothetical protein